LADGGDELYSFTDILSRSRPVVPRVTPPVIRSFQAYTSVHSPVIDLLSQSTAESVSSP